MYNFFSLRFRCSNVLTPNGKIYSQINIIAGTINAEFNCYTKKLHIRHCPRCRRSIHSHYTQLQAIILYCSKPFLCFFFFLPRIALRSFRDMQIYRTRFQTLCLQVPTSKVYNGLRKQIVLTKSSGEGFLFGAVRQNLAPSVKTICLMIILANITA